MVGEPTVAGSSAGPGDLPGPPVGGAESPHPAGAADLTSASSAGGTGHAGSAPGDGPEVAVEDARLAPSGMTDVRPVPVGTTDVRPAPSGTTDAVDGDAGLSLPVGPVAYRVGSDGTTEPVPRRRPAAPESTPADPATPAGPAPMAAAPSPDPGSPPGAAPVPVPAGPVPAGPVPAGPGLPGSVVGASSVSAVGSGPDDDGWQEAYAVAARDVLRGLVASAAEPIAGGRHKVFGHRRPGRRPDHLHDRLAPAPGGRPRASPSSGCAAVDAAGRRGEPASRGVRPWPRRRRSWSARSATPRSTTPAPPPRSTPPAGSTTRGLRLPVLFVCEDNGLGHQRARRRTAGWSATLRARPGLRLLRRRRLRPGRRATTRRPRPRPGCARQRRPAVLHLRTVRLMGHAGADAEIGVPQPAEIAADLARDPLVATARLLVEAGLAHRRGGAGPLRRDRLAGAPDRRGGASPSRSWPAAAEVVPRWRPAGRCGSPGRWPRRPSAAAGPDAAAAVGAFGGKPAGAGRPADPGADASTPRSTDALVSNPADGGLRRGRGGQGRRVRGDQGPARPVRRGPGLRHAARRDVDPRARRSAPGWPALLPVPEIQYLAYLHNAEDQLRGEAATMQFFSSGRVPQPDGGARRRPRLPGGVRRPLPQRQLGRPCCGTSPAWWSPCPRGRTTPRPMLRTCLAAAEVDGSVCVFLEPIALYHTRDLHADGDGEWLRALRRAGRLGRATTCRSAGPGSTASAGRGPDHHHLRQRRTDVAAGRRPAGRARGSAAGWSTCAGWRRCRWPTSSGRPPRPAGCWSSTRPAAPAASARACSRRWSTPGTWGRRAGSPQSTRSSRSARPRARAGLARSTIIQGARRCLARLIVRIFTVSVRHLRGAPNCVDYALTGVSRTPPGSGRDEEACDSERDRGSGRRRRT